MKKVLLVGSLMIGTILIFLANISISNSTGIVAVNLNEHVNAASGYEMETVKCDDPSLTFDRCAIEEGGSCNVSDQTVCDS